MSTCQNCRWAERIDVPADLPDAQPPFRYHRNAPIAMPDARAWPGSIEWAIWPQVEAGDWCGEFVKAGRVQ